MQKHKNMDIKYSKSNLKFGFVVIHENLRKYDKYAFWNWNLKNSISDFRNKMDIYADSVEKKMDYLYNQNVNISN